MAYNTKTSIVDYLKSIDQDSSYKARKQLASKHGIDNYKGTYDQNTSLLQTLRQPKEKPKATAQKPVAQKPAQPSVQQPTQQSFVQTVQQPVQAQYQEPEAPKQPNYTAPEAPKQPTYNAPTAPVTPEAPKQATIEEMAKLFGLDYSREGVQQQTEAEAQAKRDAIASQKRSVDAGIEGSADALDRNYFLRGLQQAQNQTNSGLNGGIAADQNLRMAMSRQAELGDVYRDANVEKMRLEDNLGRVDLERLARENALYNDRRQQGFQNTMSYNDMLRRNYESDRNFDRSTFENDRNFGRSAFESDRGFNQNVFENQRNFDRNLFESDRNYGRGVFESDRNYDRNVYQDDRNYNRGIFESDRGFNENVFQDRRNYDRGVLESDRNYDFQQDRAKVADNQWQKSFDWGKYTFNNQSAASRASSGLGWANHNLSRDRFEHDQQVYLADQAAKLEEERRKNEELKKGLPSNRPWTNIDGFGRTSRR